MFTRRQCTLVDGLANLACGTLTISAPVLWDRLDLPSSARRHAGFAMVGGGVLMLGSQVCVNPSSRQAAVAAQVSVGANLIWAGLGIAAVNTSRRTDARWVLASIAVYDAAMGLAKAQTS